MWQTYFEAAAATYFVLLSMAVRVDGSLSALISFKLIPMMIGLPLAFHVFSVLTN